MVHQCCNVAVGDIHDDNNGEANDETFNTDNNIMKKQ